ncbi:MAG: ABC transporter permease [Candidatus Heimdallarchaeota archaeon]|nr:ABC transporter permease [Candidatus Heimdallarchaeota archaeon]
MMVLQGKNLKQILTAITPILLFLLAWEALSYVHVLDPALFSRPSKILSTIYTMAFVDMVKIDIDLPLVTIITGDSLYVGTLILDIISSINRLVVSFVLASIVGILIGLIMGTNPFIFRFLNVILTTFLPIPGIAWAPIFLVWLGFGDSTLIAVGFIAALFPIIQNVSISTTSVDKKMVWASKSMGANDLSLFLHVLLPNSFPFLFTGFKLGLARAWRTIIAVELISSASAGLGVMIFTAREFLQPYKIYGGIFVLAILYFMIELLLRLLEKQTIEKWGMTDMGVFYE